MHLPRSVGRTAGRMMGRNLVWGPAAAGCPLSPFTSAGCKGFGQAHGVCGAVLRGKGSVIGEDAAVVVDHTDVSILSSPPSYLLSSLWQALQEQAWAELPLCSHSPRQRRG